MRQRLGQRTLRRYERLIGCRFTAGLVRGGTGHRVDLRRDSGEWLHYWPANRSEPEHLSDSPERPCLHDWNPTDLGWDHCRACQEWRPSGPRADLNEIKVSEKTTLQRNKARR